MNNQGKKYDLIAAEFSALRDGFYKEQKYLDLFMQYLTPGASILDIGCGSGHPIANYLINHGFIITGIDASKELLKIAKQKCPEMQTIYGDIRTVKLNHLYDGILEWWCLFHLPKKDHEKIIARFASWLKEDGILEFTTGDHAYQGSSSEMLNQELHYYSHATACYEKFLKRHNFKILLRENDQKDHMVWIAQYKP